MQQIIWILYNSFLPALTLVLGVAYGASIGGLGTLGELVFGGLGGGAAS